MHDPLNPLEGQDPLDPLDDPMLDAIERSMENPPGMTDPLTANDDLFTDDIARQLDQVEAHIENMPPVLGTNEVVDSSLDRLIDPESFLPEEDNGHTVTTGESTVAFQPQAMAVPPTSTPQRAWRNPKDPYTLRRRGGGGRRSRLQRRQRSLGSRTIAGRVPSMRLCPETHELIDSKRCESCDKYRHWPEGIDEEPRECWYDWQTARQVAESEDSEDEE